MGQNGVAAKRHLEAERLRLQENRDMLVAANNSLASTKESLLYDGDALSVHLRQLGFVLPGERFIRVMGVSPNPEITIPEKQVSYSVAFLFVPNLTIVIISVVCGLATLIFLLINDFYQIRDAVKPDLSRVKGFVPGRGFWGRSV
ncbi:MAG: septum formation initiator family protein [Treponema sp.]|nr:septum formation initiator family protein [Treponema sp.]